MVAPVTAVMGSPLLPGREPSYLGFAPGTPTAMWRQVTSVPAPTLPLGLALSGAPGGAHAMAQGAIAVTGGSATTSSAAYPFPVSSPPAVYRRLSGPALLPMQLAVAVPASPLASPGTTHRAVVHVLTTGASPAASSSVWAAPIGSANIVMDHLRTPRMASTPMSPAPLTPRPSLATPTPRPSPATTVPGQSASASAREPVASAAAADGAWAANVGGNTTSAAATGAVAGVDAAVGAATAGRFPSTRGGGAATAAALAEAAPPPAVSLPSPLVAPGAEGDGVAALRDRFDKAIGAARDAVAAGGTEAPASDAYLEGAALRWQLWNLQRPAVRTLDGRPGASSPQATPRFPSFVALPLDVASFVASLLMELDQADVQSEQGFAAMASLNGRLEALLEEEAGGSGGKDWRAEAQGLQKLCERLAEDLSRMHQAYTDSIADGVESCGSKDAVLEQLKQVEVNLEMLGGENLRLRRAVRSRPAAKALASRRRPASVNLPRACTVSAAAGASAARRGGSLTLEPSRSTATRRAASVSSSKPRSLQLPPGGPAVAGAEERRARRLSEPLAQAPGSAGDSLQRRAASAVVVAAAAAAAESANSSPRRRAASDCGSPRSHGSPRSTASPRNFLGEVHPSMSLADAMGRWRRREDERAAEARHVASRRRLPSLGSGGSVIWAPPCPERVGTRPTL